MHEVGLMQDTLNLALEEARRAGATRIHRLMMQIGRLSGVVPEALEFAFEILAKGTMADGATLEIEQVPIVCYCAGCAREFQPPTMICECPACGNPSLDVRRGREIQLSSLEVS